VTLLLPFFFRHSGEKPESISAHLDARPWMPAFAGMTRRKADVGAGWVRQHPS
jgi:hypothetical protein